MKITRLSVLLISALLFSSCQSGPVATRLVPEASGMPGYSSLGAQGVFKGKSFTASATQVREAADPFLSTLLEKRYVVISMTIENTSGSTVIYKPNYTALVNTVDYLKPLDYTDIYQMDWDAADRLRGRLYDLDTTLRPGERATGILVFTPLSEDAKGAAVEVRELYVGTETTRFTLPFKLTADPS